MGGERRGGPGRGAAGPELQLPWEGWAPQRAGGGQDPRAAGRSCPLPPRLRSLPALAKSPEQPEVESPPPPATSRHLPSHTSVFLSLSSLVPLFPVLLSLHLPLCLLWESYWRHNQAEHQTEEDGRSSFLIQATPISLDPQLC